MVCVCIIKTGWGWGDGSGSKHLPCMYDIGTQISSIHISGGHVDSGLQEAETRDPLSKLARLD